MVHLRTEAAGTDHRGDLHRARHDHRMARLAPRVRNDRQRMTPVDAGRIRRGNVVRHDDPLVDEPRKVFRGLAEQVRQHALRHVADVPRPFPQVLVVDLRERHDVAARHFVEAALDVPPRFLEGADRFRDQRLIFQHQQVRIEDPGLVRPQVPLHFIADPLDLLPRDQHRTIETRHFVSPLLRLHFVRRHLQIRLQVHEHLAIGDPLRGGDALHHKFGLWVGLLGHGGNRHRIGGGAPTPGEL